MKPNAPLIDSSIALDAVRAILDQHSAPTKQQKRAATKYVVERLFDSDYPASTNALAALASSRVQKGTIMQTQQSHQPAATKPGVLNGARTEPPATRGAPALNLGPDPVKVLDKYLRAGERALSRDERVILNTMSTTTGSQGGFSVPTAMFESLTETLKSYNVIRRVATVIPRSNGESLAFPLSDGTAEVGEAIAQNTTATALDPAFASVTVASAKWSSKVVTVPYELAQDAAFDLFAWLGKRAGQRIGRAESAAYVTGTTGVQTLAAAGKVGLTGQTLTVIYDDLCDLANSVDPAYRESPGTAFMMASSTYFSICRIKDASGAPIIDANERKLLGFPVLFSNDLPAMSASAKSILFGAFDTYAIVDCGEPLIFRLDDSGYAKFGQIGFIVWTRSGGNLIDAGSPIKYYQNSAT